MKALFDRMMVQYEWLSQSSVGGWLPVAATTKKKRGRKPSAFVLSPEGSNIRGGRKDDSRKTPAP